LAELSFSPLAIDCRHMSWLAAFDELADYAAPFSTLSFFDFRFIFTLPLEMFIFDFHSQPPFSLMPLRSQSC
jgi:hypothetical protein